MHGPRILPNTYPIAITTMSTAHHGEGEREREREREMPSSSTIESFNVFFQGWLARQQAFLDKLLGISFHKPQPSHLNTATATDTEEAIAIDQLIERIVSHYGEYYEEKTKVMRQDVFLVFSPPWLTSFEKAFLWVAGFRPSLAFNVMQNFVPNMSSEQVNIVIRLKANTIKEELDVMDEFASVQESIGFPPLSSELARQQVRDGEVFDLDETENELKIGMARAVERADNLRRSVVMEIVRILNRDQTVKFLTAVAKLHHVVRAWGIQKDLQRE